MQQNSLDLGSTSKPSGGVVMRTSNASVRASLGWRLRNMLRWGFIKGWLSVAVGAPIANFFGAMSVTSELKLRVRRWYDYGEAAHFMSLRHMGLLEEAEAYAKFKTYWEDYGVVSRRVITNNGVGYIVDAFQNLKELENMNYHGIGTNNTAEANGDSALGAESTTNLNPDNTRATGTQTEPASNQYRTTGTLTADGAIAAVEHGVFDQAATGGGVLFDRSVYSTINLASGDSLQAQYTATFSAGG